MRQKIALTVASAAAALTLAVALAAAGFAPGAPAAASTTAATAADPATTDGPPVQVDTIYVAAPPKQATITVHKVVRTVGGESESEHESGNDD